MNFLLQLTFVPTLTAAAAADLPTAEPGTKGAHTFHTAVYNGTQNSVSSL